MKLKVKLDPGAKMPTRAHDWDAGLDLYAMHNAIIKPYTRAVIDTGTHVAIPHGYAGLLTSKSGLMRKDGVTTRGTIDSDYTGSIQAIVFNHTHKAMKVKKGQKVTQLVIVPIITPEPELVDDLEVTDRGDSGFGSTGAF